MTVTLPGLGVATPLPDLLAAYSALVDNLPAVIDQHPSARVVRNRVGNLTIVAANDDGSVEDLGWIDVRTGNIELRDEPWPVDGPRCPCCGGPPILGPYGVCRPCAAAMGWDPRCEACHLEAAGQIAEVPHVDTCAEGAKETR